MSRFVEEEDEDLGVLGVNINSTDPRDLAQAAIKAAWGAYEALATDRIRAQRWAEVSRAFSAAVDAAMQTQDRNGVAKHAGERVDPLGIGTQIHAAAEQFALPWPDTNEPYEAHMGRLMWCALYLAGVPSVVIPQHVWDQSGGAHVTITTREDGGKLIRRS